MPLVHRSNSVKKSSTSLPDSAHSTSGASVTNNSEVSSINLKDAKYRKKQLEIAIHHLKKSNPTPKPPSIIKLKLVSLFLLFATASFWTWLDISSTLLDPQIINVWFYLFVLSFTVGVVYFVYFGIVLHFLVNISESEWERRFERQVFVPTFAGFISGISFIGMIWPVHGFMSIILVLLILVTMVYFPSLLL